MKIEEIFVGPERDRFIDDKQGQFAGSSNLAKISDFYLRKYVTSDTIEYGLTNTDEKIVGYLKIEQYKNDLFRVVYSEVVPEIRGHGYGTFLYDYAIMNDGLRLLSDTHQTPHAKGLWEKFRQYRKFDVVPYNLITDKEEPELKEDDVYEEEHLLWLARSRGETINEALQRINSRNNGRSWEVLWYGPFVNNEY